MDGPVGDIIATPVGRLLTPPLPDRSVSFDIALRPPPMVVGSTKTTSPCFPVADFHQANHLLILFPDHHLSERNDKPSLVTRKTSEGALADCQHSNHWSMDECPGLTQAEIEFGEKVKSVGLTFVTSGGRDQFHGPTVRERVDEMFTNAKRYGNPPPEYEGRAVLR